MDSYKFACIKFRVRNLAKANDMPELQEIRIPIKQCKGKHLRLDVVKTILEKHHD